MHNQDKSRDFGTRAGAFMIAAAWILFFAFLIWVFSYSISQRNNPNQSIDTITQGYQKEVILERNPYGHYLANGSINNTQVTFMLDTGATDIAVPESLANKLGLEKQYSITVKTANGIAKAYRTRLQSVGIGEIVLQDLNATIVTNMQGDEALLGMNFLKHFELVQKGKTLTIRQ